jgi:hypothetical protein
MPLLWLGTIVVHLVSMLKLVLMCYQCKWQSWADMGGGGGIVLGYWWFPPTTSRYEGGVKLVGCLSVWHQCLKQYVGWVAVICHQCLKQCVGCVPVSWNQCSKQRCAHGLALLAGWSSWKPDKLHIS